MKTAKIKVSVIVPAYNTAEYLPRCLDSLVRQTLKEIEIIVVDNNSNDDGKTADVIKSYAERYPKLIVPLFCKKPGASAARNMGIRHAKGDFIGFADSDDYCDTNMFLKLYAATGGNSNIMAVCEATKHYIDKNRAPEILAMPTQINRDIKKVFIFSPLGLWAILVGRRLLIENHLFFNEHIIYEDTAYMPPLVLYVEDIKNVSEALYHYIQRDGSVIMDQEYNTKLEDVYESLECVRSSFKRAGQFSRYKNEIEMTYIECLLYSANLRFARYKTAKHNHCKINQIMKKEFLNWRKNPYYRQKNLKFKIICLLYWYNQAWMVNLLYFIKTKTKPSSV